MLRTITVLALMIISWQAIAQHAIYTRGYRIWETVGEDGDNKLLLTDTTKTSVFRFTADGHIEHNIDNKIKKYKIDEVLEGGEEDGILTMRLIDAEYTTCALSIHIQIRRITVTYVNTDETPNRYKTKEYYITSMNQPEIEKMWKTSKSPQPAATPSR